RKPMTTPTASSRAMVSTAAASNPFHAGTGGRIGASAIDRTSASIARTRAGTERLPTIGMATSIAPMRSITHSTVPMMAKACWPSMTTRVTESTAGLCAGGPFPGSGKGLREEGAGGGGHRDARLADQVRYALEQQRGEFHQVPDQQAAQREQG